MNAERLGVVLGVAVAALALSGCGGTGSGPDTGGVGTLSVLEKWQRFEDGEPTLRMTQAQVAGAWRVGREAVDPLRGPGAGDHQHRQRPRHRATRQSPCRTSPRQRCFHAGQARAMSVRIRTTRTRPLRSLPCWSTTTSRWPWLKAHTA